MVISLSLVCAKAKSWISDNDEGKLIVVKSELANAADPIFVTLLGKSILLIPVSLNKSLIISEIPASKVTVFRFLAPKKIALWP